MQCKVFSRSKKISQFYFRSDLLSFMHIKYPAIILINSNSILNANKTIYCSTVICTSSCSRKSYFVIKHQKRQTEPAGNLTAVIWHNVCKNPNQTTKY